MAIEIKDLIINFDNKTAVNNVSLSISEQKITSLIGPNGCGKSTLLKAVTGNIKSNDSTISIKNKKLESYSNKELSKVLSFLPQKKAVPGDFTVERVVSFGRYSYLNWRGSIGKKDQEIMEWAMEKCEISHLRDEMSGNLSGGEMQRVWLAMILAQDSEIIILDEPTTFLDISHQLELLELLKELNEKENKTIFMVLHDINQALKYSDEIFLMKQGKIIDKRNLENIFNDDVINKVFNIDYEILKDKNEGINIVIHKNS